MRGLCMVGSVGGVGAMLGVGWAVTVFEEHARPKFVRNSEASVAVKRRPSG